MFFISLIRIEIIFDHDLLKYQQFQQQLLKQCQICEDTFNLVNKTCINISGDGNKNKDLKNAMMEMKLSLMYAKIVNTIINGLILKYKQGIYYIVSNYDEKESKKTIQLLEQLRKKNYLINLYSRIKGCLVCQENNVCLQCNNEEQFILDNETLIIALLNTIQRRKFNQQIVKIIKIQRKFKLVTVKIPTTTIMMRMFKFYKVIINYLN
ncbi:unnamed protein product [Paramecium primaurelia]|uniref:Uncharacterized protein n=1 Tax=Paramecium primaurelia TaxID=5886 RepID=A0A8S1QSC2_PARPR|nr:unnamed protein product [Paramecium primaurelia]